MVMDGWITEIAAFAENNLFHASTYILSYACSIVCAHNLYFFPLHYASRAYFQFHQSIISYHSYSSCGSKYLETPCVDSNRCPIIESLRCRYPVLSLNTLFGSPPISATISQPVRRPPEPTRLACIGELPNFPGWRSFSACWFSVALVIL